MRWSPRIPRGRGSWDPWGGNSTVPWVRGPWVSWVGGPRAPRWRGPWVPRGRGPRVPLGRVLKVLTVVLADYKEDDRVRCASPIFMLIAYYLGFTNRKRKYFEEKTMATLKSKQTSIATVQNHLRTLRASFPTPSFFIGHYLQLNILKPNETLPAKNSFKHLF